MSGTFEAKDLFATAKILHALAKYVGDYMYDNWDDIPDDEKKDLERLAMSLLTIASQLNSKSLLNSIQLLDEEAAAIKESIKKILNVIGNMDDTKELIDIAAKVIAFGAAIAVGVSSGNLQVALPAAAALINEFNG